MFFKDVKKEAWWEKNQPLKSRGWLVRVAPRGYDTTLNFKFCVLYRLGLTLFLHLFCSYMSPDRGAEGSRLSQVAVIKASPVPVRGQPSTLMQIICCWVTLPCPHWFFPVVKLQAINERVIRSHFQFSSVAQSCLISCDPMNCSTPGLPVYHHLLESTQTHVHQVGDAIQPPHPLSSASPPALNLSQHQGLFK